MELRDKIAALVNRFNRAKESGSLSNASEETIRTWLNELLAVFGWDVKDTHQVLQERTLDKEKRKKLNDDSNLFVFDDDGKPALTIMGKKRLSIAAFMAWI